MTAFCRVWRITTTDGVTIPFFQTTRRDHTKEAILGMLPKTGADGYMIPVLGDHSGIAVEFYHGKPYVKLTSDQVDKVWYEDDLPPAQSLRLFDHINASTTEGN